MIDEHRSGAPTPPVEQARLATLLPHEAIVLTGKIALGADDFVL